MRRLAFVKTMPAERLAYASGLLYMVTYRARRCRIGSRVRLNQMRCMAANSNWRPLASRLRVLGGKEA